MLFVIIARDKPDSAALRQRTREAHLRYLADAGARIKVAGPLLSGEGAGDGRGQPVGSLILIDAASEGAVKLFADHDPYSAAGLFETVEIRPFRGVVGDWLPADTTA